MNNYSVNTDFLGDIETEYLSQYQSIEELEKEFLVPFLTQNFHNETETETAN